MTERMAIVASQLIPLRTHLFLNVNCAILVDFRTLKNFGPAALVKSHTEKVKISVVEDSLSPYSPTVSCLLSDQKLPCLPVMGKWIWLYKLSQHLTWNTIVNRGCYEGTLQETLPSSQNHLPWLLTLVSLLASFQMGTAYSEQMPGGIQRGSSTQQQTVNYLAICRKEPS